MKEILENNTTLEVLNEEELIQIEGGSLPALMAWAFIAGVAYGYVKENI